MSREVVNDDVDDSDDVVVFVMDELVASNDEVDGDDDNDVVACGVLLVNIAVDDVNKVVLQKLLMTITAMMMGMLHVLTHANEKVSKDKEVELVVELVMHKDVIKLSVLTPNSLLKMNDYTLMPEMMRRSLMLM